MIPDLRAAVDAALDTELSVRRAEVVGFDRRLAATVDRLVTFVAGGKRIRPEFLWWGWRAGGGRADPADCAPVVRIGAALELIQACALLHDDVIDRSATRRGNPSVHVAVAKQHADDGAVGDPEQYGIAVAVLLGDLALAWADDLFTASAHQLRALDRAQGPWRAMRTEVMAGQLLDVAAGSRPPDLAGDADDAVRVNRLKTAAYTVERPLHLGAALAGATPATIAALRDYGVAVGTAFQLRDDLLGVFGDPAVTGKPAGGDLVEGKRTLLLAGTRARLAADPAGRADLAELDAGLGRSDAATVTRLTDLIAATGAAADLERDIDILMAQANSVLRRLDLADGQPAGGRPAGDVVPALRDLALRAGYRTA